MTCEIYLSRPRVKCGGKSVITIQISWERILSMQARLLGPYEVMGEQVAESRRSIAHRRDGSQDAESCMQNLAAAVFAEITPGRQVVPESSAKLEYPRVIAILSIDAIRPLHSKPPAQALPLHCWNTPGNATGATWGSSGPLWVGFLTPRSP